MSGTIKNWNKLLEPLGNFPSLDAFSLDKIPSLGDTKSNISYWDLAEALSWQKILTILYWRKQMIWTSLTPSRSIKVKRTTNLTSRTMAVHTLSHRRIKKEQKEDIFLTHRFQVNCSRRKSKRFLPKRNDVPGRNTTHNIPSIARSRGCRRDEALRDGRRAKSARRKTNPSYSLWIVNSLFTAKPVTENRSAAAKSIIYFKPYSLKDS